MTRALSVLTSVTEIRPDSFRTDISFSDVRTPLASEPGGKESTFFFILSFILMLGLLATTKQLQHPSFSQIQASQLIFAVTCQVYIVTYYVPDPYCGHVSVHVL